MWSVYQITFLVLIAGSVRGAPSEDLPAAASDLRPVDSDLKTDQASSPVSITNSVPPSADPNIKAAEESWELVRTQLKEAVTAILAPVFNADDLTASGPNIKAAEESLKKLRTQLLDAVAAIGMSNNNGDKVRASVEATVSVPEAIKPIETGLSAIKTYKQIIGQFITEMIQIPIVFLHAFSDAISGITGSKTPTIVYQGAGAGGATAVTVQTSPQKKEST